ncbi:unnamed protein product [Malus baccata var. baccata]
MADKSLFVKEDDGDVVIMLLYADDIILTGSSTTKVQSVISQLAKVFDLKDMGQLTYFLGLQIHYQVDGSIFRAGMESCKPTSTPSKPHYQVLISEGSPIVDPTYYKSIVGALQYLTFTQPDIAHAVNVMCQYMTQPSDLHMHLVKRILRYLKGTIHCGLKYTKSPDFILSAYSDLDWAADINTRRSITGYVVYIGYNPISWQSKRQSTVSQSFTEAEYKALAHCAADVFWIRSLLKDLYRFLPVPPHLHCDNLSTLALCSNPVFHSKIKHLDTYYHFVRERVQK